MSVLRVVCTGCGSALVAPASAAGKRVRCPKCLTILEVPEPEAIATLLPSEGPVQAPPPLPTKDRIIEDFRRPTFAATPRKKRSRLPLLLGLGGGAALLLLLCCGGGGGLLWWLIASNLPYEIRTKDFPDLGKTMSVKSTMTLKGTLELEQQPKRGAPVPPELNLQIVEEYTLAVLESGQTAPRKFKRTYQRAVETTNGNEVHKPQEGRTVVFETQPNGKVRAVAEGQPALAKAALEELIRGSTSLPVPIDPKRGSVPDRLKLGKLTPVDMMKIAGGFPKEAMGGMELDGARSSGVVKLVRVYRQNGRQFGEIEVKMTMALKNIPSGAPDVRLDHCLLVMNVKMDACIDGSSTQRTITGPISMSFEGSVSQGGWRIPMTMFQEGTTTQTHSAEQ